MSKAFDTVWMNALLYKLERKMILTENCYVVEQLLVHTISESCIEGFIITII